MYLIVETMLNVKCRDIVRDPLMWDFGSSETIGVCEEKAFAEAYMYAEAQKYLAEHHLDGDENWVKVHEMDDGILRIDHEGVCMIYSCEEVKVLE